MRPVYPRWRGEHKTKLLHKFHSRGLSPLARGTHARTGSRTTNCRFIPAGAGNTFFVASSRIFSPVYPRWRGEHAVVRPGSAVESGLSPLARGTRYAACLSNEENSVYPRWRGEHCWMSLSNTERSGLSPLARGTLCYPLKTADSRRFIPAGAGNTLLPAQNRRFASVYPRWRGEHSASVQAGTRYSGLSPLARGTH